MLTKLSAKFDRLNEEVNVVSSGYDKTLNRDEALLMSLM